MKKIRYNENHLLHLLHQGTVVPPDEVDRHIEGACGKMDRREDCADFTTVSVLRILYLYRSSLSDRHVRRLKDAFLGFRYWMDEPGDDSMCFWSENHQILFATAEYLAGQLWPEDVFLNDGRTGAEHGLSARRRIMDWLELRWTYGFSEWYSNVYYVEDLGPLANLIDFSDDEDIRKRAAIITDLLLLDVATQSWKGSFVSNSGRLYEVHKKGGGGSSMRDVTAFLFGYPSPAAEPRIGMDLNFLYCRDYSVPEVLREIGRDENTVIVRSSNGLDTADLGREGLLGHGDRQIMMQWGMEAFTNPETISNSLTYIRHHGMFGNDALKEFRRLDRPVIRRPGVLKILSKILDLPSNGIALQRSNSYMYRNRHFSLSTSQAYHPGTPGDQQHIWQATLAPDLSVFTTHPACFRADERRGRTPGYWVGSGRLPHSVQHENINLTVYRLRNRKNAFTHAWFPEDRFDDVRLVGRKAFGRKGRTLIAVIAGSDLEYLPEEGLPAEAPRTELRQRGRDTWWITELSSLDDEGTFDAFISRMRGNPVGFYHRRPFDKSILMYYSGGNDFELTYSGEFLVNGEVQDSDYRRLESPYSEIAVKPGKINIEWKSRTLELDFQNSYRSTT